VSEFENEVSERVQEARRSLAEAEASGDEYLVGVRLGVLESLARLAADHGLQVPGLAEDMARLAGTGRIDAVTEAGLAVTGPVDTGQIDLTAVQAEDPTPA